MPSVGHHPPHITIQYYTSVVPVFNSAIFLPLESSTLPEHPESSLPCCSSSRLSGVGLVSCLYAKLSASPSSLPQPYIVGASLTSQQPSPLRGGTANNAHTLPKLCIFIKQSIYYNDIGSSSGRRSSHFFSPSGLCEVTRRCSDERDLPRPRCSVGADEEEKGDKKKGDHREEGGGDFGLPFMKDRMLEAVRALRKKARSVPTSGPLPDEGRDQVNAQNGFLNFLQDNTNQFQTQHHQVTWSETEIQQ